MAAEEMTVVHDVTETVRRTEGLAMMEVAVVSVARGKIVAVAMNVVVRADQADSAALQVVDNAQALAAAVAHQVREVLPIVLQAVAVAHQAANVALMTVAHVLMAEEIAVLVQKGPIVAQGPRAEIVVLVERGIVVLADATTAGMTGISMIVLAFLKVGLCGCCPNHVRWKRFQNKSKHPAGHTLFSMSRNFSFPAGIVICCTFISRNQPVARISLKTPLQQLKPQRRNCCNAHSTDRSG